MFRLYKLLFLIILFQTIGHIFATEPLSDKLYLKAKYYKSYFAYDSAIYNYKLAVNTSLLEKNYLTAIQSRIELANIYLEMNAIHLATDELNQSEKLLNLNKNRQSEEFAAYYDLRGSIEFIEGSPNKALDYYNKSLQIRKSIYKSADIRLLRSYEHFLAYYYELIDKNNANKIIDIVTKIIDQNRNLQNLADLPLVYNNLACAFKMCTDEKDFDKKYQVVRKYLNRGISIVSNQNPINYHILGVLHHTLANTFTDEVFNLSNSKYKTNRNKELNLIAYKRASENYKKASDCFYKIYKGVHENLSRSYFTRGLMNIYYSKDSLETALRFYDKAYSAIQNKNKSAEYYFADKPFRLSIIQQKIFALWKMYKKTKNNQFLILAYNQAMEGIAIWEKIVYEVDAADKNKLINTYRLNPLTFCMKYAYELFKNTKIKSYLNTYYILGEKNKYFELIKTLNQSTNNQLSDKKEIIEYKKLIAQRNRLQDQTIVDYYTNKTQNPTELNTCKNRISQIMAEIRKQYPAYFKANFQLLIPDLNEIQKKLIDKNTVVINYTSISVDFCDSLEALVITKDRCVPIDRLANNEDLIQHCKKYYNAIQTCDYYSYTKEATYLYQTLVAPCLKGLPTEINKIVIIPDASFSEITFDALLIDNKNTEQKDYRKLSYLINKYSVSTQMSLSLYNYLQQSAKVSKNGGLLAISPEFKNKQMANLPFSIQETKTLSKKYKGVFLCENTATKQNFEKYSNSDFGIIQFSTHSKIDIANSSDSKLFFSQYGCADSNNCLRLGEINNKQFKADLIILNACESSIGQNEFGEGIIGFPRAFLMAGSNSVLSTLWKTDDESNSKLIQSFYQEFEKTTSKSEALRNTKLNYLGSAE